MSAPSIWRQRGLGVASSLVVALTIGCATADATARAPASAPAEPLIRHHQVKLGGAARLGGTAGHMLMAPFAFALPGGGGDLKYRYARDDRWFAEGRGHLSLGVDEGGVLGGGYSLAGAVGGYWFDVRWCALSTDFHLGLSSYSLIPIPMAGLYHELMFVPVDVGWLAWDIKLKASSDLLLIVPNLGAGASTALTFTIGPVLLGAELAAEGDLLIAVVMNSASGALSARLFTGFEL